MTTIVLARARAMIAAGFERGSELELRPLSIVVLDAGGHVKAFERQDGVSNLSFEIAHGNAYGKTDNYDEQMELYARDIAPQFCRAS